MRKKGPAVDRRYRAVYGVEGWGGGGFSAPDAKGHLSLSLESPSIALLLSPPDPTRTLGQASSLSINEGRA